jgi:hypothetical protein
MKALQKDICGAVFQIRSGFLAFNKVHGYNLT